MHLLNLAYDREADQLTVWVVPDMSDWSVEILLVSHEPTEAHPYTFRASVVEVRNYLDASSESFEYLKAAEWLSLPHVLADLHTYWRTLRN